MSSSTNPRKATIVTGASRASARNLHAFSRPRGMRSCWWRAGATGFEALSAEIAASGAQKPLVVALDLCKVGAADALEQALREAVLTVEILVNNAGFGLIGPAIGLGAAEQLAMVDLNVRALTELTLRFQRDIVAARGAVLNVASIAAFMPGPNFAVYYATKAYVRSFSEALAQEMAPLGVKVKWLCPGRWRRVSRRARDSDLRERCRR